MRDTNALFDELLAAYRSADDPDRFLREFLMRLEDATTNAVVATERKLDKLDAAGARLDAARKVPRPETAQLADGEEEQDAAGEQEQEQDADEEQEQEQEQDEEPAEPKRRNSKKPVAETEAA